MTPGIIRAANRTAATPAAAIPSKREHRGHEA
jgi:hypothetical protein